MAEESRFRLPVKAIKVLPLEFVLTGSPRTAQTKNSASRSNWKGNVAATVRGCWNGPIIGQESFQVAITHFCFFQKDVTPDLDGIPKLILDGMEKIVYDDDKQIMQVNCRRIDRNERFQLNTTLDSLLASLARNDSVIHVRLDFMNDLEISI